MFSYINEMIIDLPDVIAWNTPRIGNPVFGVVTAYDDESTSDPDRDFIDLHALVQNIGRELMNEEQL